MAHGPSGSMEDRPAVGGERVELGLAHFNRHGYGTNREWCIAATTVLQPVTCAKRRLSASLNVNEFAMSVAAVELEAAAKEATTWMAANECPDVVLGTRRSVDVGHMRRSRAYRSKCGRVCRHHRAGSRRRRRTPGGH